jgi:hypothetical protein
MTDEAGRILLPKQKPVFVSIDVIDQVPMWITHRTAQVVVDQGARHALKCGKGFDVAAEKTLQRLIDREEREDGARKREHHHEARGRTHAVVDANRPDAPQSICASSVASVVRRR